MHVCGAAWCCWSSDVHELSPLQHGQEQPRLLGQVVVLVSGFARQKHKTYGFAGLAEAMGFANELQGDGPVHGFLLYVYDAPDVGDE